MTNAEFTQEDWRRILNALKMATDEHEKRAAMIRKWFTSAKTAFHRAHDIDYDFSQQAAETEKFHNAECEKYKILQIRVWMFAHD